MYVAGAKSECICVCVCVCVRALLVLDGVRLLVPVVDVQTSMLNFDYTYINIKSEWLFLLCTL